MALAIRLKRMGRKKRPFYRVIVADKRNPRQGLSVDDIGYYNPMVDPAEIQIDEEKALKWLEEGAIPSETAKSLLSKKGILSKFHGQEPEEKDEPQEVEQPDEEGEEQDEEQEEQTEDQPDSEQNEQEEP